jgi:prolipoprotein diacylglyceryltransferase
MGMDLFLVISVLLFVIGISFQLRLGRVSWRGFTFLVFSVWASGMRLILPLVQSDAASIAYPEVSLQTTILSWVMLAVAGSAMLVLALMSSNPRLFRRSSEKPSAAQSQSVA